MNMEQAPQRIECPEYDAPRDEIIHFLSAVTIINYILIDDFFDLTAEEMFRDLLESQDINKIRFFIEIFKNNILYITRPPILRRYFDN